MMLHIQPTKNKGTVRSWQKPIRSASQLTPSAQ